MSSKTKNLGLLKKDPILDKNDTFNIQTMLNDNWDKLDGAVGGGFQQAKAYTDEQISLVTATGIPKLVSYPLQVTATEDNQTNFEIPLDTFEVATDTLIVVINRAFLDATQYTVKGAVRDETGALVKRAELVIAKGVAEGSELSLLVMKNVPIGEDGAINGAVLAKGSVPIDRVSGLDEKLVESKIELSNATNGTRETVAATEKAVKTAYDRANEAFQSASNGKTQIATAITGKGVSASGSDTFAQLASKVSSISVGAKVATGSMKGIYIGANINNYYLSPMSTEVRDLNLIPSFLIIPINIEHYFFKDNNDLLYSMNYSGNLAFSRSHISDNIISSVSERLATNVELALRVRVGWNSNGFSLSFSGTDYWNSNIKSYGLNIRFGNYIAIE